MDVFSKAKEKAGGVGDNPKNGKSSGIVTLDDVAAEIDQFVEVSRKIKDLDSNKSVLQEEIKVSAINKWLAKYMEAGRVPDTMKFRGKESTVTFIMQDRGGRASDEQMIGLKSLLGEERAGRLIEEDTKFSFNSTALTKPEVREALGKCIENMAKSGILTQDEAENLIEATPVRMIKKGTVADLHNICHGQSNEMQNLLGALGSAATYYVKP